MARVSVTLTGAVLTALVLGGCSSDASQAAARAAVARVPVPAGAVLLDETSEFGPIEVRSYATAHRHYALPVDVDAACAVVVRTLLAAGYTVVDPDPVTDPDADCAADLARERAAEHDPGLHGDLLSTYPPGAPHTGSKGADTVSTSEAKPGSPYPSGSTLLVNSPDPP